MASRSYRYSFCVIYFAFGRGQQCRCRSKQSFQSSWAFLLHRPRPQSLGPNWETHIVLTELDLDMIHAAVTQQIHGKAVGTTASWSNPASYNWGSIRLVKKLALRDQQCEELEYTVHSVGPENYPEHYHFTSCLQLDGTWKIA
jgi:hypothetical protein